MGSRRTSSQKRVVPGIIRTKADTPMKTSKQRRRTSGASTKSTSAAGTSCAKEKRSTTESAKPIRRTSVGTVSPTACKLLEWTEISQVPFVASELEEFDGTKASTEKSSNQCCLDELPHELSPKASGPSPPCHTIQTGSLEMPILVSRQTSQPLAKFKLQLFPIDEVTRKGLEKDEHNPHLELTLGARKKISSVIKHLNTKWGNSSIALGELVLFPYNTQESLTSYRRWTSKDADISAEDVYATIGCPPIFRLRYGWFSSLEPTTSQVPHLTSLSFDDCLQPQDVQKGCANMKIMDEQNQPCQDMKVIEVEKQPCQEEIPAYVSASSNAAIARVIPMDQAVDVRNLRKGSNTTFSSALWADSLTNISMGDLLKETSRNTEANHCDQLSVEKDSCLSRIPFSSDSFDAAIAAHIYRHQGAGLSTPAFHTSIWDAEETCHAFPFQKVATTSEEVAAPTQDAAFGAFSQIASANSMRFPDSVKGHACQEPTTAFLPHEQGLDNSQSNFRMTDINWSDSLGPLDLGLSSSQQIISGDSISLSGLIGNSLDAFQNCSFLSRDWKAPSS